MARAVEFARSAECGQLFGRAFDAGALLADQEQLAPGQSCGQGAQQVVGEFAGFRQEQHRGGEILRGRRYAKVAAPGKAGCQQRLFAGVPAPAPGFRQTAEQVIGRQAGKQQRAAEQFGLTQQHFASRVHGVGSWEKRGG
ncbi:hypothetical protein D3C86_1673640 [compost metagenome]